MKLEHHPVVTPPFEHRAMRLGADGAFIPPDNHEEIGLLYRPIVTQISRWDRLKGFRPLIEGFVRLKGRLEAGEVNGDGRHRRRLEIARLVLAGPDPDSIQDDPEGQEVLEELKGLYRGLSPELQKDIALLSLPMESRKHNALMVNALQRCSSIIVQNSLREGFGLTAAEGMWKRVPVLATNACGLRQQVRDGIDGLLTRDPEDPEEIAENLDYLLGHMHQRSLMRRNGQRRVHDEFLVFRQVRRWLRLLATDGEA
jgi:trehalose synthase